jgi:GNAT superfamily N-acetyltransferase
MTRDFTGIGYTGVLKSHRRRGLAWGLKVTGAQAAKEAGAKWIRTHNDPGNSPILAINDRMGFQWVPGPRILEKTLR